MKKNKSEPVKTALTISIGFLLIFLITKWNWTLATSFIIGLIGIFSDYLSKILEAFWSKITFLLSLLVPNIILGIIFYFFLFPIALISKLFNKKDPLILKNRLNSTYVVVNKEFDKSSFENPW